MKETVFIKNPAAQALGALGGAAANGKKKARTSPDQIEARRRGIRKYWAAKRKAKLATI